MNSRVVLKACTVSLGRDQAADLNLNPRSHSLAVWPEWVLSLPWIAIFLSEKNGGNNISCIPHRIAKRIKLDYSYKQCLTFTKCYDNYLLWPLFNNETTGYIISDVLKAPEPNWVRSAPYQDKCPVGHIPLLVAWTSRGSWEGRLTQFGQHFYGQIGPTT